MKEAGLLSLVSWTSNTFLFVLRIVKLFTFLKIPWAPFVTGDGLRCLRIVVIIQVI